MKKSLLFISVFTSITSFSQVGINTETPQKNLHVNGSLQITNELNVGGNSSIEGGAGIEGQVLTSNGPGLAPNWKKPNISTASGVLSKIDYLIGTESVRVSEGNTAIVPGLTYTITVPNTVNSQTLSFTIVGYAPKSISVNSPKSQGVFSLYQGNTKLTSSYVSIASDNSSSNGALADLPIPSTMIYQTSLNPGTYTFTVRYTSWTGTVLINKDPSNYLGYNGDNQAMLSRMQIQIFNN